MKSRKIKCDICPPFPSQLTMDSIQHFMAKILGKCSDLLVSLIIYQDVVGIYLFRQFRESFYASYCLYSVHP